MWCCAEFNCRTARLQTEKYSAGSAQAELYPKDIDQFIIPFVQEKIQDEICQKAGFLLNDNKRKQIITSDDITDFEFADIFQLIND